MIVDQIENKDLYSNLNPNIKKALDYLAETDFSETEAGKYEIDGENIFALVSEYKTKDLSRKANPNLTKITLMYSSFIPVKSLSVTLHLAIRKLLNLIMRQMILPSMIVSNHFALFRRKCLRFSSLLIFICPALELPILF